MPWEMELQSKIKGKNIFNFPNFLFVGKKDNLLM